MKKGKDTYRLILDIKKDGFKDWSSKDDDDCMDSVYNHINKLIREEISKKLNSQTSKEFENYIKKIAKKRCEKILKYIFHSYPDSYLEEALVLNNCYE